MTVYVSVPQAAKELGMTPQTLRYLMQTGRLQIGDAWKRPGASRGGYKVVRTLLDAEKRRRGIED